jgi:hypothetical protein
MNGRNYRTLGEINPDLFRDLIAGSKRTQATPESEAPAGNGIMLPRRPPNEELRRQTESFTEGQPVQDNQAQYILETVAANMGRSADDPERVANAIVSQPSYNTRTMGDPSIDLGEYENLPPLDELLGRDQTRSALGTPDPVNVEGSTRGAVPVSQQEGNAPESALSVSEELYSPVGGAYRDDQIVSYSYYREPVQQDGLRGRSRKAGDAPQDVQRAAMEAIIQQGKAAGLSNEDIALTLAIARHESGFNPDAAAGTTSAHGLGQFVNRTGEAYGLTDENRWDLNEQARALVEHTRDNIRLAERNGQGREYVYAYHHDGPSLAYGGLQIGRQNVMPRVADYLELVENYSGE